MAELKIQSSTSIESGVFTAIILFEDNRSATRPHLPEAVGVNLLDNPDALSEKYNGYYFTGEHKFISYCIGKELKVEAFRKLLHQIVTQANKMGNKHLQIVCMGLQTIVDVDLFGIAMGELPFLSTYQFNKYKKEVKDPIVIESIVYFSDLPGLEKYLTMGGNVGKATCLARDLVNEPPNILTPVELASRAVLAGEEQGFKVEVFDKEKITTLKMGGILSVNRGSQDPPTFSILEYKHQNAKNTKPVVLVGKGITFDTGGLSLKPTAGSMDSMKCDMAGAAAVIGAFYAIAANQLPIHIIGLIPSTDNRPGENAYTPNDVITMYDGSTIEVLNTDAEGRLILADALSYAKELDPELVIDLATLTGSAVMAVGADTIALMSNTEEKIKNTLKQAGERVFERMVELPLWPEYAEQLKSDIADMKNIGGKYAGAITAGKFLEYFTAYPWAHLDIAGPAYNDSPVNYRGKNGTGIGVRLLFEFIRNYAV